MKHLLKPRNIFLIFLLLILVFKCKTSNNKERFTILEPKDKISSLSDSIYFSKIFSIIPGEDDFIISDLSANHILECNYDHSLKYKYGSTGRGPGEFIAPASIFVKNDTLFAFDNGNHRFNIFCMGNGSLGTVPYPRDITPNLGKFVVDNGYIYVSSISKELPIIKIDFYGNIVKRFGQNPNTLTGSKESTPNQYHLLYDSHDNSILAINQEVPIIYKYDFNGVLITSYNLSDNPLFRRRLEFIAEESLKENKKKAHFMVIQDACILHNMLYLLYVDRINNKDICRNIIELNIADFKIKNVYELNNNEKSVYFSFCVVKNNISKDILAFDVISSEIHLFNINSDLKNELPTIPNNFKMIYKDQN